MKKKIAGWVLLALGSFGLLGNLIIWLPNLMESDIGVFIVNSCMCIIFIIIGLVLIKKGVKRCA